MIVLNYNGLRFLEDCLQSLKRLDYPSDRYEVVVVDNVSADGSADLVEKQFPQFRVVRNERNLGFAGGNNVAVRTSRADYVALLNNDTSVSPLWLGELVEAAELDPQVGACTSKLLFQQDRVRVDLEATPFRPRDFGSPDQRVLGARFLSASTLQSGKSSAAEYLGGFYGFEPSPEGPFRWSAAVATLGCRVSKGDEPAVLRLTVAAPRPDGGQARLTLRAEGLSLGEFELAPQPRVIEVHLPKQVVDKARPVIQNAGTIILPDGSGRDRGTVVKGTEVYSEEDTGQYDRQEEVFAGCGAAMLLRRAMLEDVGLLDEDFYMYYEDMDLSWRARRRGWKILYVPGAVVRHVHAASSVEWSPFFVYHVERNRLLMLAKNAPLGLAAAEHLRYAATATLNLGRYLRSTVRRAPDNKTLRLRVATQLRVLGWLTRQLPRTLSKRRQLQRRDRVPASKILTWMVPA
ncbi:MAG: glycosyltransferase family 2 protein [Sphingomonadaceae bacterium]